MNKIEIKCPKCGSKKIECYHEYSIDGVHLEHSVCCDCEAQFDVKYMAIEIKLD